MTTWANSCAKLNRRRSPVIEAFRPGEVQSSVRAYPYSTQAQNYWRDIPGGAFFIPIDKIVNLNVSYVDEGGPGADARRAMDELEAQGIEYDIQLFTSFSDASKPDDEDGGEDAVPK